VYRFNTKLQWALVVLAGVASFASAFQWRRATTVSETALVELATAERQRAPARPAAPGAAAHQADSALALPDRSRTVPQSGGNAMAELRWVAPVPAPSAARALVRAAPPAPEVPLAPPLPFSFVGLMEQGGPKPQAFLAKGNTLLVVAAGDVIEEDTYRVDALSPQHIQLTYLPLNTAQTLNILGASK
jgi:hypothetical protein